MTINEKNIMLITFIGYNWSRTPQITTYFQDPTDHNLFLKKEKQLYEKTWKMTILLILLTDNYNKLLEKNNLQQLLYLLSFSKNLQHQTNSGPNDKAKRNLMSSFLLLKRNHIACKHQLYKCL